MYSVRVKSNPSLRLEDLAVLGTHDGKRVPGDKELRVSGGWKVKDRAGTSSSSFGRGPHRQAAIDGLKGLLDKALGQRECSHLSACIWRAVVPESPQYVTVANLRHLVSAVEVIDRLSEKSGLPADRCASLVAHAMQVGGIHPLADETGVAHLDSAAGLMAKEESLLEAETAYLRTEVAPPATVVHLAVPRIASSEIPGPSGVAARQPGGTGAQPSASPTPQVTPEASPARGVVRVNRLELTDLQRADRNAGIILRGGTPIGVASVISATQKPVLLKKLLAHLERLPKGETQAQTYRLHLLRVHQFFEAWRACRPTNQCSPLTPEDLADYPLSLLEAMKQAKQLDDHKLKAAR